MDRSARCCAWPSLPRSDSSSLHIHTYTYIYIYVHVLLARIPSPSVYFVIALGCGQPPPLPARTFSFCCCRCWCCSHCARPLPRLLFGYLPLRRVVVWCIQTHLCVPSSRFRACVCVCARVSSCAPPPLPCTLSAHKTTTRPFNLSRFFFVRWLSNRLTRLVGDESLTSSAEHCFAFLFRLSSFIFVCPPSLATSGRRCTPSKAVHLVSCRDTYVGVTS